MTHHVLFVWVYLLREVVLASDGRDESLRLQKLFRRSLAVGQEYEIV